MHCGAATVVTALALALALAVRGSWRNLLSSSFDLISVVMTSIVLRPNENGFCAHRQRHGIGK